MNILRMVFLGLFFAYMAYAVLSNRRRAEQVPGEVGPAAWFLQTPLFLLACYVAFADGAISRDLVSPLYIGLGLLAGHLIFGLSLLVTHRSWRDTAEHFFDLQALWAFLIENPNMLLRLFVVSLSEELIYRAAAQPLLVDALGRPMVAILIVAAAFAVVHWHFFRNPILESAEFVAFAVLLGVLYYWTGSLTLVVVVHTLRNFEIGYLEYVVRTEELGDAAAAQRELDQTYGVRGAAQS